MKKPAQTSKQKTKAIALGKSYVKMRKQLMTQLKGVDANVLISVVRQGEGKIPGLGSNFFSDWPDTYNRDTWYKTWAKAEMADLPATIRPIITDVKTSRPRKKSVKSKKR